MENKGVFSGDLGFIALGELFQILGGNNSTGVLRLTSPYVPEDGVIYFVKGNPVNAQSGGLRGLDGIYALFGWMEGHFEFIEEKVQVERVVKASRMEIVLDALRMLDDGLINRVETGKPQSLSKPPFSPIPTLPLIKGQFIDFTYLVDDEFFYDGKRIVREKDYGNWMWVVLEGKLRVSRDTPRGPLPIVLLGEGSFIGTFSALAFRDHARTATVTAEGDAFLGIIDSERLSWEFRSLSPLFRKLLMSLSMRLVKITDKVVAQVTNDREHPLIPADSLRGNFAECDKEAYVIQEGECYVVNSNSPNSSPLFALGKEDIFGHIPFLHMNQEPHQARIMGSEKAKAERIDIKSLQLEYDYLSNTLKNSISSMSSCITETTRIALSQMGRHLDPSNPYSIIYSPWWFHRHPSGPGHDLQP